MLHRVAFAITSVLFFSTAYTTLALEPGTYSGKNAKGGAIVVVVTKDGLATYNFRGKDVPVKSVKASGTGLDMVVGNEGVARVMLKETSKNKVAFTYTYKENRDAATLTKK